jgi:membrane protease YdiL (CAAX protease family)
MMKLQCFACSALNVSRARFCRKCGERLSERQPTSIRRVAEEPVVIALEPKPEQMAAATVNVLPALLMWALLCVNYKAYLTLVEHTPNAYLGVLAVDALIIALFALPARDRIRPLFAFGKAWILAAALGGVLMALTYFSADRFTHWLGTPLDPGLHVWFERGGSPAWLAVLSVLVLWPVIMEVGMRGYFQTELSGVMPPVQASVVTALISASYEMFPQQLPFSFVSALVLTELRRRSSSLIPCIVASSVAGALSMFVFSSGS